MVYFPLDQPHLTGLATSVFGVNSMALQKKDTLLGHKVSKNKYEYGKLKHVYHFKKKMFYRHFITWVYIVKALNRNSSLIIFILNGNQS